MTPDKSYIIFSSNRVDSVQHIFRMNADGSNQIQLTKGFREFHPKLSPDGKWVYYAENIPNSEWVNICKISIDGGAPTIIAKSYGRVGIDVSTRSGLIAYVNNEDGEKVGSGKIYIISPDGGEPIKTLLLPPTAHGGFIQWTPDERAIAFNDSRKGGANVWAITLGGNSEVKPLTNFTSEQTLNFDWSPNGKQLVASRGSLLTDAILITGAK
jgi:Tol biopolymer transport system component